MALPTRLVITSAEQAAVLVDAGESLHDIEMDECRSILQASGNFIDSKDLTSHMSRCVAIQEVIQYLKHIIPPVSHSHPTIIPLSGTQAEVVDTMIDFAFDFADDTVTDPIFYLKGVEMTDAMVKELRSQMNSCIDRLVAAAQIKHAWLLERHS